MSLEELLAEWDRDTDTDYTRLGQQSVEISKLHAKYYRHYVMESVRLKKLQQERARMYADLYEHYTQGPSLESQAKGWRMPPSGRILKGDAKMYIDADENMHAVDTRVTIQDEKVKMLDSIIRMIRDRSFQLRTAVDFEKMKAGN